MEYLFEHCAGNSAKTQLLQKGVFDGSYLVRDVEALKICAQYGVSMVAPYMLVSATRRGDYEVAKFLIEAGNDVNYYNPKIGAPLGVAVEYGFFDIVELLVENGVGVGHIDEDRQSVLFTASRTSANITQYLVESGADVNVQDQTGETPLMVAVSWGWADCTKILLDAGADAAVQDENGKSAAAMVKKGSYKEIRDLFL